MISIINFIYEERRMKKRRESLLVLNLNDSLFYDTLTPSINNSPDIIVIMMISMKMNMIIMILG